MATVRPLLADGTRVLEVGCAEGTFGAEVKKQAKVEYTGLEISLDANAALSCLDHVLTRPVSAQNDDSYDLLLAFHVLEHIADISAELGHWRRMLGQLGTIVIEVPNGAGHPLRDWDFHPEHLHFFSGASLAALAGRSGFYVKALTTSHFESPIYADSLRLVASIEPEPDARRERLVSRFRRLMGGPFVVYGVGGDFRNCVLPVLDSLPIVAITDSDPARVGERLASGHLIQTYDPIRFAGVPVLVASLRFKKEICRHLQEISAGMTIHVTGLDDIYALE